MTRGALSTWGTDATFASGPQTGDPVIVEPSSGQKEQGFIPGEKGAAELMNWNLNQLWEWVSGIANGVGIAPRNQEFTDPASGNHHPWDVVAGINGQRLISVGEGSSATDNYLARSLDYGVTWAGVTGQPSIGTAKLRHVHFGNLVYVAAGEVDTTTTVLSSDQTAASWARRTVTNVGTVNGGLYEPVNAVHILCASDTPDSTILTSPDGTTWTPVTITGRILAGAIASDPSGRVVINDVGGDIGYSDDGGATWTWVNPSGGVPRDIVWDAIAEQYFATGNNGVTWTSADGSVWVNNAAFDASFDCRGLAVHKGVLMTMHVDSGSPATDDRLAFSLDHGKTWTITRIFNISPPAAFAQVRAVGDGESMRFYTCFGSSSIDGFWRSLFF